MRLNSYEWWTRTNRNRELELAALKAEIAALKHELALLRPPFVSQGQDDTNWADWTADRSVSSLSKTDLVGKLRKLMSSFKWNPPVEPTSTYEK